MPSLAAALFSPKRAPVCLMNWNILTLKSRPQARKITPRAAVVLPLPLPVLTIMSPVRPRRLLARPLGGCRRVLGVHCSPPFSCDWRLFDSRKLRVGNGFGRERGDIGRWQGSVLPPDRSGSGSELPLSGLGRLIRSRRKKTLWCRG